MLPPNATDFEKSCVGTLERDLPIALHHLWDPKRCPETFLPYLAQAFSVDYWDVTWTVPEKRAAIASAFFVHQHKGTIAALRHVIKPFAHLVRVEEWFDSGSVPHTFRLVLAVFESGINDSAYANMLALIEDAKPLRSHLQEIEFYQEIPSYASIGTYAYSADITTIYPRGLL